MISNLISFKYSTINILCRDDDFFTKLEREREREREREGERGVLSQVRPHMAFRPAEFISVLSNTRST